MREPDMNDKQNKLYVDLTTADWPLRAQAMITQAEGYLLPSGDLPEGLDMENKDIIFDDVLPPGQQEPDMAQLAPSPVHERVTARICRSGLVKAARLRDQFPDFSWIPWVDTTRLDTAYHFPTTHYSESFRTFQPVFSSQGQYLVDDGAAPLNSWLKKAAELGFDTVWLNASQAATAQKGLDLELRELALKNWPKNLWLSGGAQTIMHMKYLVNEGGVDALVIPAGLACALGCDKIQAALQLDLNRAERKAVVAPQTKPSPVNDLPGAG